MSLSKIPAKIIIAVILLLSIINFLYDALVFYGFPKIQTWNYISEAFSIGIILLFYLYIRRKALFSETEVRPNLKNFVKVLALLAVLTVLMKIILRPEFAPGTFPQQPQNFRSVVYANMASLAAIAFSVPLVLTLKNLIYYRFKKRTALYLNITLVLSALNILFTVFSESLPDFAFTTQGILFMVTIYFLFLLATRNSWITYLSRSEKRIYFLVSVVLVVVVIYLYDFAFDQVVVYHSFALAVFTTLAHFFLIFYATLASMYLMIQLPTARAFDRKMREVSSMHHLSRAIAGEYNFEKLVRMVTELSSEVIESSLSWLEIYDEKNGTLKVASSKNLSAEDIRVLNERKDFSTSLSIMATREALVVNNIAKSEQYKDIVRWKKNIGSFAGVPLIGAKDQAMGILYAAKNESFGFDPDDVNMLEAYANQAAIALENAHLLQSSLERERMEKELQIARDVQLRLLPQETPHFHDIQIEAMTITAYEVGGDYYDFYQNSDSRFLGLIIGDVSGKGTSAAFYMAEAKGIIQSLARNYNSPRDILINTNRILHPSLEKKSFISLLAASINKETNSIQYARAGHCPIIHYRAAEKQTYSLQSEGIAVGLDSGTIFEEKLEECQISVEKGDILVFYTDGLSEARNRYEQEFGEERLCRIIRENAHLEAGNLREILIDNILGFLDGQNLHDDLTMILMKI